MNRKSYKVIGVLAIILIATVSVSAQSSRTELVFGLRIGATYIAVEAWDAYNTTMQTTFPDSDRTYFPIITQFGLNIEQRILLGTTRSHFVFQEVLLVVGIDQNMLLPSVSTLIGFRSRAGLEIGMGPNFAMSLKDGDAVLAMSVVFAAGWTFSFSDMNVSVNIAIVPTPRDGNLRLTILSGFNFNVSRNK